METSSESSTSSRPPGSTNSPSKSKSVEKKIDPIVLSGAGHALVLGAISIAMFLRVGGGEKVEIQVYEQPVAAPTMPQPIAAPKAIPKEVVQPRKVFGVSRNAVTDESSAVGDKAGNTLAAPPDDKKLLDSDKDLPIPTDEYLVDTMPVLKDEIRVPYPPEAKAKNIEGPVVMDVLVDAGGVVKQVNVISGPGFGLNEAAATALQKFHFLPAKVKGQSVAVRIRYTYRFILEK